MRRLLFLIWLVLSLSPVTAEGQSAASSNILSFADRLFDEGDYYRAITEYKRFLHLAPQDPAARRVLLAMGEAYLAGERWQQADEVLQRLTQEHPATAEANRALLLRGDSALLRGDPLLAAGRYRFALKAAAPRPLRRDAHWRSAWSLIEGDALDQARAHLQSLRKEEAERLACRLDQFDTLPLKSPGLAGTLSAVIPGAGQLYAGRPREAGLSFALNTAFIAGALESFRNDQHVLGGILLFFEFGWYTGNIYNAVNSVQKHNRDLRDEQKKTLKREFGLTLGLTPDGAVMPGFRFTF